jgi:hypothetical protein
MSFEDEARRLFGNVISGESQFQPALSRTPARRNFCGSTASPSILVS